MKYILEKIENILLFSLPTLNVPYRILSHCSVLHNPFLERRILKAHLSVGTSPTSNLSRAALNVEFWAVSARFGVFRHWSTKQPI